MDEQTFIFADLAGFTALTEAHGDESAAELVEDFCARARALLPQHGCVEVKAIGDALMIRAPVAADGVRLAGRLAGELGGRHGFPALRVGVHTGAAVERGADWFGAAVNLASRVSNAATAGEVLVTGAAREAAGDDLNGLRFEPRGTMRFRHVREPVEVFALTSPGAVATSSLARDPVCHMLVDPARAAASRAYRGREHHFCSEACARAFDEEPGRYGARASVSRTQLLASDAGRERAVKLLQRAFARGRISQEELEERAAHAYAARTRGELSAVLADMPERRRLRRRRRWWRLLVPRRRR